MYPELITNYLKLVTAMLQKTKILVLLALLPAFARSQQHHYIIHGNFTDSTTGNSVVNASISLTNSNKPSAVSCVVDVWNQKVIVDLNSFGLGDVQESHTKLLGKDGMLYVFIKNNSSRWYIAQYNPATNTLTKGLEIYGGVTGVRRIDVLN